MVVYRPLRLAEPTGQATTQPGRAAQRYVSSGPRRVDQLSADDSDDAEGLMLGRLDLADVRELLVAGREGVTEATDSWSNIIISLPHR